MFSNKLGRAIRAGYAAAKTEWNTVETPAYVRVVAEKAQEAGRQAAETTRRAVNGSRAAAKRAGRVVRDADKKALACRAAVYAARVAYVAVRTAWARRQAQELGLTWERGTARGFVGAMYVQSVRGQAKREMRFGC